MILELANPKKNSVFVDLGHGTGRAIIAAAMLRGDIFKECIGIELLVPLVDASKLALTRYDELIKSKPNIYPHTSITLHQGDILSSEASGQTDWTHGDLIFANSTCFTHDLMVRFLQTISFIYF